MNTQKSYEIEFLKSEVAKTFGSRISITSDFLALSMNIIEKTGVDLSVSTLKRVWGVVSLSPCHRLTTLDVLAQYTGRKDFRELVLELKDSSNFFSTKSVLSDELEQNDCVRLEWLPDRQVILQHVVGNNFLVLDSGTSKLCDGDQVKVREFIQGHPLIINSVIRGGKDLGSYEAGNQAGLQDITVY